MRKFILAIALAATVTPALVVSQPAAAQSREDRRDWRDDRRDDRREWKDERRDDRREWKDERHERRADRREDRRDYRHDRAEWRGYNRYDYNRPDPRYGRTYDARRYYRDGSYYQERRLTRADRIYRGNDGRYYCRRNDGTTGLIIGALAGGLLGNALDNGRSSTLGTILGAGGGALVGRSIDRGEARCR